MPERKRGRIEYFVFTSALLFAAAFVFASCFGSFAADANEVDITNEAGDASSVGVFFNTGSTDTVLRITDWETGEVYIEHAVLPGDELYFGWIHSLEKIPWDEYYHIDEELNLILDTIRFPAFGAGIPENKGSVCYFKDGLIYMSGIDQKFTEFVWMNSHTATQEIRVADEYVTRGSELPKRRLVLNISRRNLNG